MTLHKLGRHLLHVEHSDEHGHEAVGSTLDLRIASIFVILFSGLVGGLPPLFIHSWRRPNDLSGMLVRVFSGGVILALALVHIAPEAIEALDSFSDDFPVGGPVITAGVLLILFSECCFHSHLHSHQPMKPAPAPEGGKAAPDSEANTHSHECLSSHSVTYETSKGEGNHVLVTAYTMEFGCVFHSFVIGLGLGVIVSGKSQVVALLIALVFHQLLEAFSLGSVIALAHIPLWKAITMILTYSLTIPVGVGIGIGISDTYDPESATARAVEGSLNAVAAGMLLYIAILQLLGEEFSRSDVRRTWYLRWLLFLSATFGAGCMILLAKWA